jgi:hypothetical protein
VEIDQAAQFAFIVVPVVFSEAFYIFSNFYSLSLEICSNFPQNICVSDALVRIIETGGVNEGDATVTIEVV